MKARHWTLILFLTGATWLALQAIATTFESPRLSGRTFAVDVWALRAVLMVGVLVLLANVAITVVAVRSGAAHTWAPVRWFFQVFVASSAVYLFAMQPVSKESPDLTAGLAASLWGLVLILTYVFREQSAPRWLRAVDVISFNLALFAFSAEAGLRLWGAAFSSPILIPSGHEPAAFVERQKRIRRPGEFHFGFPLNSRGYYDDEFEPRHPERATIAMISDSFGFGVVPHRFNFTTVCEQRLGLADVLNFAYPGLGPLEYLHLLSREVLAFAPDVVAVNLFVGNDVFEARRHARDHPQLRRFWDRDNLLIDLVPRRLARRQEEKRALADEYASLPVHEDDGLERRIEEIEELAALYPWLRDPSLERASFSRDRYLKIQAKRASAVCDPKHSKFEALFQALEDLSRAAGDTPIVFQLIPDEFQLDEDLWREVVGRSHRGNEFVRDLPQQKIGQWLEERSIPYLLPHLAANCSDHHGRDHCYHLRDTHWNARGNRLAGEAMADFLAPHVD